MTDVSRSANKIDEMLNSYMELMKPQVEAALEEQDEIIRRTTAIIGPEIAKNIQYEERLARIIEETEFIKSLEDFDFKKEYIDNVNKLMVPESIAENEALNYAYHELRKKAEATIRDKNRIILEIIEGFAEFVPDSRRIDEDREKGFIHQSSDMHGSLNALMFSLVQGGFAERNPDNQNPIPIVFVDISTGNEFNTIDELNSAVTRGIVKIGDIRPLPDFIPTQDFVTRYNDGGDLCDRGPQSEILELLMIRLKRKALEKFDIVVPTNFGNHELAVAYGVRESSLKNGGNDIYSITNGAFGNPESFDKMSKLIQKEILTGRMLAFKQEGPVIFGHTAITKDSLKHLYTFIKDKEFSEADFDFSPHDSDIDKIQLIDDFSSLKSGILRLGDIVKNGRKLNIEEMQQLIPLLNTAAKMSLVLKNEEQKKALQGIIKDLVFVRSLKKGEVKEVKDLISDDVTFVVGHDHTKDHKAQTRDSQKIINTDTDRSNSGDLEGISHANTTILKIDSSDVKIERQDEAQIARYTEGMQQKSPSRLAFESVQAEKDRVEILLQMAKDELDISIQQVSENETIKTLEEEISSINRKIEKQRENMPKVFGKKAAEEEIERMTKRINELVLLKTVKAKEIIAQKQQKFTAINNKLAVLQEKGDAILAKMPERERQMLSSEVRNHMAQLSAERTASRR